MWCVHKLSVINGLGGEDERSYLCFDAYQSQMWFVCVILRDTETGKFTHISRKGDDVFIDWLKERSPYGFVPVNLKSDMAKPGFTLIVIDDLSLQFLSYVSKVSFLDVKRTDERALAVAKSYVVSDRFLTRFRSLDDEFTLFMSSASGLVTSRGCTLLQAISFCKTGWLGDSFYMLNQSIPSSNKGEWLRRIFKVDFEDLSRARQMISRLVLSGENPLVKAIARI